MSRNTRIRNLINRLARLDAAGGWVGDLNPTQKAALEYLARANRYSRAPSQVADFIGTTRGTMSQTLKALMRKGYVSEQRQKTDQRSISYALTTTGAEILNQSNLVAEAISTLPDTVQQQLEQLLEQGLRAALTANGGRSFGLCHSCSHHRDHGDHGYCALLKLALEPGEKHKICIEHSPGVLS